jgi:hypothetical protein
MPKLNLSYLPSTDLNLPKTLEQRFKNLNWQMDKIIATESPDLKWPKKEIRSNSVRRNDLPRLKRWALLEPIGEVVSSVFGLTSAISSQVIP